MNKIRKALLDAGIEQVKISYDGGNDEGGGWLDDPKAKAVLVAAKLDNDNEATWEFVDSYVDQLGYGSWAGEFHAYGHFLADVANRGVIVKDSHQGQYGSMSYDDV